VGKVNVKTCSVVGVEGRGAKLPQRVIPRQTDLRGRG